MNGTTTLDTIYDTWRDIEGVYLMKGNGKTKKEFLQTMLAPTAIVAARDAAMRDFVETPENLEKLNELFNNLKQAQDNLEAFTEDCDMNQFIWEGPEKYLDLDEYQVFKQVEDLRDDSFELLRNNKYRNSYTLKGGKVKCLKIGLNSEDTLFLADENSVINWLYSYEDISQESQFIRGVYAYIESRLKNGKSNFYPGTFVSPRCASTVRHSAGHANNTVTLEGTYYTLAKKPFETNLTCYEYLISNGLELERVVAIE